MAGAVEGNVDGAAASDKANATIRKAEEELRIVGVLDFRGDA